MVRRVKNKTLCRLIVRVRDRKENSDTLKTKPHWDRTAGGGPTLFCMCADCGLSLVMFRFFCCFFDSGVCRIALDLIASLFVLIPS